MDASGFAKSLLLAFVDDDIPSEASSAIRDAVHAMARTRDWTVRPPEVVDQVDDGDHTLGAVLVLYAPRAEDGRPLPVEIDHRLLADARCFVERIAALSRQLHVTFGFELDQDSVGWVVNGDPDTLLSEGLLGEWARMLGS
jgi:hypothetical protein